MARHIPSSDLDKDSPDRTPASVLSTTLRSLSCGGFEYNERQVVARPLNPRHFHDYHCIGFLIAGLGTAEFGREYWTVQPGCLNVIPGGVHHVERFASREIRWIGIELPGLREPYIALGRRAFARPVQLRGGPAGAIAARIHRELALADDASLLSLHGLGLELLAVLARSAGPANGKDRRVWVGRMEEYLRANFLESVTLDDVAAEVGIHPTHMARVFRRRFGVSMGEFVRGLRIEHAAGLMARSDLPLSDIAHASGFSDQAHFTRVFRRRLGVTPGDYRRRLRRR